jgi:hypothetical protein
VVRLGFEGFVSIRCIVETHAVCDDEGRIDLIKLDQLEQRLHVFVYVRLAHLESQALCERGPEWKLVKKSPIDTGYRNSATLSAGVNCLA